MKRCFNTLLAASVASAIVVACSEAETTEEVPRAPATESTSRAPTTSPSHESEPDPDGTDSGTTSTRDGGSTPPDPCSQDAPCAGDFACYRDDGVENRVCRCSGSKLACMVTIPSPPSGCAAAEACVGAETCAVDDGSEARYCRCTGGAYACETRKGILPATCTTTVEDCLFGEPPGATEWILCAWRKADGASGAQICEKSGGGVGMTTVHFDRVCPDAAPVTGSACIAGSEPTGGAFILQGVACACQKPNGTPCVCGCRRPDPLTPVSWLCLP